jgi:K+-transporting ATPase KdpF subunit
MEIILNIFLAAPMLFPKNNMPLEMNSIFWYVTGGIVALLLLIYLVIALVKPEKF